MHHPTDRGLCYTSCGTLAGTGNSPVGPPQGTNVISTDREVMG